MRKKAAVINGWLNVWKGQGMTSMDCVSILRKLYGVRKVGHCGTLDPNATGVLSVAFGSATRFIEYMSKEKAYNTTVRFGITTDTDDVWGSTLRHASVSSLREREVELASRSFLGSTKQTPPLFSAVKIDGVPMYQRGRKGDQESVKLLKSRDVFVENLRMTEFREGPNAEADFEIECRSGFYVRSFARDLGNMMDFSYLENPNVGGIASKIERTKCGSFVLEDSISLEKLADLSYHDRRRQILPVDGPLRDHISQKLQLVDRTDLNRFRSNMLEIPFRENKHDVDSLCRVYCQEARPVFVGLAKLSTHGRAVKVTPVKLCPETPLFDDSFERKKKKKKGGFVTYDL